MLLRGGNIAQGWKFALGTEVALGRKLLWETKCEMKCVKLRRNAWASFALHVRSCSGENMLWEEEENWQKRREFYQFLEKLERFWKN